MKDIEPQVFTAIATALRAAFPGIYVTGEYEREPATFPHVCIEEFDNYVSTAQLDSATSEKFSALAYTVNIYSNKKAGKKSECRAIAAVVSDAMFKLNFIRTMQTPAPNMYEATIYRLTAQFRASTDGEKVYRR